MLTYIGFPELLEEVGDSSYDRLSSFSNSRVELLFTNETSFTGLTTIHTAITCYSILHSTTTFVALQVLKRTV